MMRRLSLLTIAEITGGQLLGEDLQVGAVSTDTRRMTADSLFIALRGERFDGHDYLNAASAAGAVAALVSVAQPGSLPQVLVDDTRKALGLLGAYNRHLSAACVIGITGSQGKTTVKEMVASILREKAPVLVTRGNLNNDLGVPLTLLEIMPEHASAVIEMGANAPGEIAYTVALAQPHIAHITNVAGTHLEGFGSLDGVFRAKSELWEGLREAGTAVINMDDAYAPQWRQQNAQRHSVLISARGNEEADYRIVSSDAGSLAGSTFRVITPQGEQTLRLPLPGRHNQANALAAMALAMEAGAGLSHVRDGLERMQPVSGRMRVVPMKSGCDLIDDSYNASPSSFRAAIDVLAAAAGKRVLVCGDMGELGESAEQAHRQVGEWAREAGIETLLAVGHMSRHTAQGYGAGAQHFASREQLLEALQGVITAPCTVLVKASRSAQLDLLVNSLSRDGA